MAGFCEIKLAEPLDNSLLGEFLPSRRLFVDFTQNPFDIRLSVLYGRSDQDFKRIKKSKNNSALFNNHDYLPNYYEQDLLSTSKEEFDSLQKHRKSILPFSEFKQEKDKKLQTFNTTENNARFVAKHGKTLGTAGTVYFNNMELENYHDINFVDSAREVLNDSFEFINNVSTKYNTSLNYPYYVNNYNINKLGSSICPFNVLEEIQLSFLTLKNLQGFKADLSIVDVRNRGFLIQNLINTSNTREIEPYDDEGINNLLLSDLNNKIEIKNYLITSSGDAFTSSVSSIRQYNATKNQQTIYMSNEKSNITPFVEDEKIDKNIHFDHTDKVNINDSEILSIITSKETRPEFLPAKNIQYTSAGTSINYEYSHGVDSIAFSGLMD